MPNIKSAVKELRKTKKRTARRAQAKHILRTSLKKSRKAIAAVDAKAKDLVLSTAKAIDKAAQKGLIKKNTRDRLKSRLQKSLNKSVKK